MTTFESFISEFYPEAFDKYQLHMLVTHCPESLIGVEVVAIRSGFSCGSEGATQMTIESYNGSGGLNGDKGQFHLSSNKRTDPWQLRRDNLGWGCDADDLINSVRLYDPQVAYILWADIKEKLKSVAV